MSHGNDTHTGTGTRVGRVAKSRFSRDHGLPVGFVRVPLKNIAGTYRELCRDTKRQHAPPLPPPLPTPSGLRVTSGGCGQGVRASAKSLQPMVRVVHSSTGSRGRG